MASIWWEEPVGAPADLAWAALRRVDLAHKLFAPVLIEGTMEGNVRTVTFANGLVVRERIIDIDESRRRVAYGVLDGAFDHHSASMQIMPISDASCRFIWVSDFLPNDQIEAVRPLVEQGSRALAQNIESGKVLD